MNGAGPTVGEIDVMECLGDNTRWSYHWDDYNRSASTLPPAWAGTMPTTADGWHTLGSTGSRVRWTTTTTASASGTTPDGVTGDPHYLIVNLAISGNQIATPQTVKVDYIRVWQ